MNNLLNVGTKRIVKLTFIKSGGFTYGDKSNFDGEIKLSGFTGISYDLNKS